MADDAPSGTEKTFTQAELDRIVGERIGREREKYAGFDEYKTKAEKLVEIEAAQQTETEKLNGKVGELEKKLTPLERENLRLRVAMEKKLPANLVDRLKGATKDELSADADQLLELVSPTPSLDGGVRVPANGSDIDSMIRRAAGR